MSTLAVREPQAQEPTRHDQTKLWESLKAHLLGVKEAAVALAASVGELSSPDARAAAQGWPSVHAAAGFANLKGGA